MAGGGQRQRLARLEVRTGLRAGEERGARTQIISNAKDEGYEKKLAVYEGINLDTLSSSFNEIREKVKAMKIKETNASHHHKHDKEADQLEQHTDSARKRETCSILTWNRRRTGWS